MAQLQRTELVNHPWAQFIFKQLLLNETAIKDSLMLVFPMFDFQTLFSFKPT